MIQSFKRLIVILIRNVRVTKVKRSVGGYNGRIFVGGKTSLSKNTFLGDNVNFNGMTVAGIGRLTIGNNFHSGTDCLIITSNHNYKGEKIPYDETHIAKDVTIEDNVWIGSKVIILGGVNIGEGAIIQAGAMVHKSVPKCAIVGGNPACVIAFRDLEKYEQLKLDGKFH
ncbi:acyltransferase [Sphingobacterium siyangense]|uniref:acyltransferase n=1 Tax=Sphingobacterium siyangense TaxID=459529 RepID=UPI003DA36CF7